MEKLSDAYWTRLPDEGIHRAFARKLDATESVFFWEGEFAGNTDLVDRITIHLEPSLRIDDPTADAARFRDIWLAMKCRFPLLAARVDELDDGRLLRLVVSEERLANIAGPDEFEYIADTEVAKRDAVFEVGMNSLNRRISPSYPSAISILRCKDAPEGTYEIVTVTAHMLSDTMANLTYARALCDVISRWPASLADSNPPLEDALRMVVASESLYPTRRFSLARQRWRKATARIINAKRRAVLASGHAQLGGQTLPRKITLKTPYTPAITTNLWSPLPVAVSRAVIAACREHRVTVGNTLPVIAQIALSRVLHRRLARGEISREEWDRRIRSSMTTFGPGNTRPLLNPEWIKRGGFEVLNCSVNVYYEKLPFLPRAPLRDPAHETSFTVDDSGAPPLEALLSRAQFWHRVGLCKRTALEIKCHPLYFELGADKAADRAALARTKSKTWRRLRAGERVDLPPLDPDLLVPTYFGASVGDIERAVPAEYPLRRSANEQPTLHRSLFPIATDLRLRLRPAQIYVGTASAGGVLNYWIFWDANVYEEALVKEWLDELLAAVTHFVRPEKQPSVTTAPTLLATRL